MKFWLKRLEPIDYDEVDHVTRVNYIYSMKELQNNYVALELTVREEDDPIDRFGTWLSKFYKYDNIIVFYNNLKLTYNREKKISKVVLFRYEKI